MELTKEQIEFLDRVCKPYHVGTGTSQRKPLQKFKITNEGKIDVKGNVEIYKLNTTEIPVKFGKVSGYFYCSYNNLTTLKNCPDSVGGGFWISNNNLTDYFKNIQKKDFPHWNKLQWSDVLMEYPFLINIGKRYIRRDVLYIFLERDIPNLKLYME